jgi:hypothetical protein
MPILKTPKTLVQVLLALTLLALSVGCSSAPQTAQVSPTSADPAPAATLPDATIQPEATVGAKDTVPYPAGGSALQDGLVSGAVLSGGDQSPEGLQDAPRTFVYQVLLDDGTQVNVSYVAFPPSPAAQAARPTLEFHAGQIQVGDRLEARGSFDPATNTLTVATSEDYIRTYPAETGTAYP